MFRILSYFTVLLFSLFLIFSCSDSSSGNDEEEQQTEAPDLQVQEVDVPDAMKKSSDPNAQKTVGFVTQANAFSNYSTFWTPQQGAEMPASALGKLPANGEWSYEWSKDSLTITMNITESDDAYHWEIIFNGSMQGETFDNWTYMEATRKKDGSEGNLYLYEYNTTNVNLQWSWMIDDEDVYTFEMIGDGFKINVLSNPNQSGSLEFYQGDGGSFTISFRSEWASDGSGSWWDYDSSGTEEDSGSWDV